MTLAFVLIAAAYLAGSVSSAILVCRLIGAPDPRSTGSGNPGATNVLRVAGKHAAAVTLAGDLLKGLLPVLVARLLGMTDLVLALCAVAAFLGHLYPLYFGFQGGKGVATLIGVLLALAWPLGLLFVAVWLLMAKLFRISSLAALTAAAATPVAAFGLDYPPPLTGALAFMVALLVYRHRSNIRNLLAGTEGHIGAR
jgi:glycerol-3-phosphate acyltransferase PlsY